MNALPRREAPWAPTALRELRRPWKLATVALGLGWLLYGALNYGIADWDVGISLLMGGLTYLLASWSVGRLAQLRRPDAIGLAVALAALFAAWYCVDGVYVLYHGLAGNRMDREGNFRASLLLYFLAGMIWFYRGGLAELRRDLIRLIPRT